MSTNFPYIILEFMFTIGFENFFRTFLYTVLEAYWYSSVWLIFSYKFLMTSVSFCLFFFNTTFFFIIIQHFIDKIYYIKYYLLLTDDLAWLISRRMIY